MTKASRRKYAGNDHRYWQGQRQKNLQVLEHAPFGSDSRSSHFYTPFCSAVAKSRLEFFIFLAFINSKDEACAEDLRDQTFNSSSQESKWPYLAISGPGLNLCALKSLIFQPQAAMSHTFDPELSCEIRNWTRAIIYVVWMGQQVLVFNFCFLARNRKNASRIQ